MFFQVHRNRFRAQRPHAPGSHHSSLRLSDVLKGKNYTEEHVLSLDPSGISVPSKAPVLKGMCLTLETIALMWVNRARSLGMTSGTFLFVGRRDLDANMQTDKLVLML